MSAIAGYTGGGGGLARPNRQDGAVSTAATTFDGQMTDWDALPAATRAYDNGAGTLVTYTVDVPQNYARKINGVPHQVMTAFRAYLDRLVLVTAVRPLAKQPNGTMRPSGPWTHHEGAVYRPVSPPVRTRGAVPPGVTETDQAQGEGRAKVPAAHRGGELAYRFLPAPVRATATKAVPDAKVWLGELVQSRGANGLPTQQRASILRMDDQRAVVVDARRGTAGVEVAAAELAALNWQVTQLTYELPTGATQVGGTGQPHQLGRQ